MYVLAGVGVTVLVLAGLMAVSAATGMAGQGMGAMMDGGMPMMDHDAMHEHC